MLQFNHRKYNEIENIVGFWKAWLCFWDSLLKVTFTTGWQNLLCLSSVFLSHRNSTGVIVPSEKGFTHVTEKENKKKKPIDIVKSTRPWEFHFLTSPQWHFAATVGSRLCLDCQGNSQAIIVVYFFFFLLAKVLKKKKRGKKKLISSTSSCNDRWLMNALPAVPMELDSVGVGAPRTFQRAPR